MSGPATMAGSLSKPQVTAAIFKMSPGTMITGPMLKEELETLKERNKEDKRLKEKFPLINGEPTWLLRHIELLQEAYAKDGWEYDIEIPKECQHRIRPSIIGSYLIFTRDKKGRKGKVTKEYITVPLSNGASWGTWKPMDDDARLPTEGRLPYIPPPGPGESKVYRGLLDRDLDAYLTAGEDPEDYEEYTINGMGVLPEDRPPRRRIISKDSSSSGSSTNRVVSKGSSSSSSSAKASTYSRSSFTTAKTSAPSQNIMDPANFAPERSLRSIRKVSNISASSSSTNNSSDSSTSLMSNGMPVPGSIRKPIYGGRSDSEGLEDDSDDGEDDENDDGDDAGQTHQPMQGSRNGQIDHYRTIQDSDDEDEDEDEIEVEDEYAVKPPTRGTGLVGYAASPSDSDGASSDEVVPLANSEKLKNVPNGIHDVGHYDEDDNDDDAGSDEDEDEAQVDYEDGEMAGIYDANEGYGEEDYGEEGYENDVYVMDGYGESVEEFEDDEWFDESGYCKFCNLHQHECECIRGDENDPMERGEDDDDYKN